MLRLAAERDARVVITVLDPEPESDSVLIEFYGEVYSTTSDEVRRRINEVMDVWREAAARCTKPVSISVQVIRRHMPYTLYRSGDSLWLVLSPRQKGRMSDDIPAFLCRRRPTGGDGIFNWAMADLEACRRDGSTREIWGATS